MGINLMPVDGKCCSFDCIYCECGFNAERIPHQPRPNCQQVCQALESCLRSLAVQGLRPDVLTFAGNGEPTAHPQFAEVVEGVRALRNCYCPAARISVLSNATHIGNPSVRAALMRVDNNILKLDTVDDRYIRLVNRPANPHYCAAEVVEHMKAFEGHVIIQTMFMHGRLGTCDVSNTSDAYVEPWLQAIASIQPQGVMIYTIDRDTPDPNLLKATPAELDAICARVQALGIACTASY